MKLNTLRDTRNSPFQLLMPLINYREKAHHYYQQFLKTDLGKIYIAIPWFKLQREWKTHNHKKGPTPIFNPRSKIALMFLKKYAQTSDKKLIEQINGNIHYQFFLGLHLDVGNPLKDPKIVSRIRVKIAENFELNGTQKALFEHWKSEMQALQKCTMDATCYESNIRYPTDQKLLWESVYWSYTQLKKVSKILQIKRPPLKYLALKRRYQTYSKKRRKTKKARKSITKSLLHFLDKINIILDQMARCSTLDKPLDLFINEQYIQKRTTIKKIYEQQVTLFNLKEKPKNRIVSLAKPYLRPIVRGKEKKPAEFGAKVHKIQIDGINFIEHMSYDAFHEGIRFQDGIELATRLTGEKLKYVGGDGLYANNANRKYATTLGIQTDFIRKGKPGKSEPERKAVATAIRKERSTRLEGSFGNEKTHYMLSRIKARTAKTELLWIFLGIHTANALEIGRRKYAGMYMDKVA